MKDLDRLVYPAKVKHQVGWTKIIETDEKSPKALWLGYKTIASIPIEFNQIENC